MQSLPKNLKVLFHRRLNQIVVLLLGFIIWQPAWAQFGWAFLGTGSSGCPQCVVQLRVETSSGTQVLSSLSRGVSVVTAGQQVGLAYGDQYLAGFCCTAGNRQEYRNYFTFDLTNIGPIGSASLLMPLPGPGPTLPAVFGPAGTVIYTVHGIPQGQEPLFFGGGDASSFEVLGTGPVLGTRTVSTADEGSTLTVPLNSAAVNYLNGVRQYPGTPQPGSPVQVALLGGAVTLPPPALPAMSKPMMAVLSGALIVMALVRFKRERTAKSSGATLMT